MFLLYKSLFGFQLRSIVVMSGLQTSLETLTLSWVYTVDTSNSSTPTVHRGVYSNTAVVVPRQLDW